MALQAISNGKLQFNGPYNVVSTAKLTLTNTGNEQVENEKKQICLEDKNKFASSYVTTKSSWSNS